jgi:endoribonuclease Dicer
MLSQVNLLIFDECHHAVNDQPMRQIMQQFEHCPVEQQPRILGLTATLLNSNCKPERVEEEVVTLEATFLSKVATCENMPAVDRYGPFYYLSLMPELSRRLNLFLLPLGTQQILLRRW